MNEYKLIDPFVGLPHPPGEAPATTDPNIARWFKDSKALWQGATVEDIISDMDEAGVETSIVTAGAGTVPSNVWAIGQDRDPAKGIATLERVAGMIKQFPGRFKGCVSLDPTEMMRAVRFLEMAVRDYGMGSCWMMPALVGLPPNHAVYFPIYAKCVELGIPVKINVGVPGPLRRALPQSPMALDEVLIAFPELTVVGTHVGHPWHLETVALLQKHANFYLITSGFAPKHVPKEIYDVVNRRVPHKLMWSSDYPILPFQRCAKEGWEVPLKDDVKRRYLRENAIEVFKLG